MSYFLEDVDGTGANTLLKLNHWNEWVGCRRFDYGCAFASLQSGVGVVSNRHAELHGKNIILGDAIDTIIFYYNQILLINADQELYPSDQIKRFQSLLFHDNNLKFIKDGFLLQAHSSNKCKMFNYW
jgi:hypothetical protein